MNKAVVFALALAAVVGFAHAESTAREGYVKLPASITTPDANGVYLMLEEGTVKTVDKAQATEVKAPNNSAAKVRCIIQPKFNGCI